MKPIVYSLQIRSKISKTSPGDQLINFFKTIQNPISRLYAECKLSLRRRFHQDRKPVTI